MFYNNKNAVSNNILVNSCVSYSIVTVLHELVDKVRRYTGNPLIY